MRETVYTIHDEDSSKQTMISLGGRSLQAGESHGYMDVLFEINTTFIACWKNVIVLVSPVGSFLVYVFNDREDMILWSFGSSSSITVIITEEILQSLGDIGITRISSFIRMQLLLLRFRKGSVESVVYWKVLHSGVYKLRMWDIRNPQVNSTDKASIATWGSYVTCVSSKYLRESYSCVLCVHVKLRTFILPTHISVRSLVRIVVRSVHGELTFGVVMIILYSLCHFLDFRTRENNFEDMRKYACGVAWDFHYTKLDFSDLHSLNMQLGIVQSSHCFVVSSQHHENQWEFFPITLFQLGFCYEVYMGNLGVMRTTPLRISCNDLMGLWLVEISCGPSMLCAFTSYTSQFVRTCASSVVLRRVFHQVLISIEAALCAIHIGSICVQPRTIYVDVWCCTTVFKGNKLIWIIYFWKNIGTCLLYS